MKTLYFEGAGWSDADSSKATNVGNCRIRTAFKNNEGKMIYLELQSTTNYKGKSGEVLGYGLFIDFCFYITDITGKNDDCNKSRLSFDKTSMRDTNYTKENIVAWINENLSCSFDSMEVLHDFEGYRVHADKRGYNLMDNHVVNHDRTLARIEAYSKIDKEYREHCNDKYSVIGLMSMDDQSVTVKCHASDERLGNKPRIAVVPVEYTEVAQ